MKTGQFDEWHAVTHSTIEQVAQLAGVSIKTVSRVLNKEPNVRDKTRSRVLDAINKLNYQPSQSARSLAGRRSYLIGLVYDNPSAAYVMDIQTGVMSACEEEGFHLLIHRCQYDDPDLPDKLVRLVRGSRLDGLILTPPVSDMGDTVARLKQHDIPLVSVAPVDHATSNDWVISNESQAAFEMTDHLILLGHERIGFIIGHPDHGSALQRLDGYRMALQRASLPYDDALIMQGDFSFDSGVRAAHDLLSLTNRPTAIFASNDYMAAGVLKAAYQRELEIPTDLSIAGFDDAPVSRQTWPSLTTIKQPVEQMSRHVTLMLINTIRGMAETIIPNQFTSQLIVRESTAAPVQTGQRKNRPAQTDQDRSAS